VREGGLQKKCNVMMAIKGRGSHANNNNIDSSMHPKVTVIHSFSHKEKE